MSFSRPERRDLALLSVESFLAQSWESKEIVILNTTGDPLFKRPHRSVREIQIKLRSSALVLEACFENASGAWCTIWNDDCVYGPDHLAGLIREADLEALVTCESYLLFDKGLNRLHTCAKPTVLSVLFSRCRHINFSHSFKSQFRTHRNVYEKQSALKVARIVVGPTSETHLDPYVPPPLKVEVVYTPSCHRSAPPLFTLRCDGDPVSGFGQSGLMLAQEFLRRNTKFSISLNVRDETCSALPKEIIEHVSAKLEDVQLALTPIFCPPALASRRTTIWWTMWESTGLKPEWIANLNQCAAVFVPNQWNEHHFKKQGVKVPIHVVPLSIDRAYLDAPITWPEGPFTFLTGGDPTHGVERKGLGAVIDCFAEAFKDKDARLSIKLSPGREIPKRYPSNVIFNNQFFTAEEMASWYRSGHVFVSAATAEGFGLMQVQALACGRPLIAAQYAGHAEYATASNGYLVDYAEAAATGVYAGLGNWACLKKESLVQQMLNAYEDYRLHRLGFRALGARKSAQKFNIAASAEVVLKHLKHYASVKSFDQVSSPFASLRKIGQNRWYHAGDIGDVIYSLAAVKKRGGGEIYLGPRHALGEDLRPRVGITPENFRFVAPVIRAQPYVKHVRWREDCPAGAGDLNLFRYYWKGRLDAECRQLGCTSRVSLASMHMAACGITSWDESPWLTAEPSLDSKGRVLVHRSLRYRNSRFPWKKIERFYGQRLAFVGLRDEYDNWCSEFGNIEYLTCGDALEMAELIAGADLFVGNQSFPMAIALGLGKTVIQESREGTGADCVLKRSNAQYVEDGSVRMVL